MVVLLLLAGVGYLLLAAPLSPEASPDAAEPAEPSPAADAIAGILDDAVENPDGSMTVTLSEAETGGLVRAGLTRTDGPTLRDVTVDLVTPDGPAPGQMVVRGRLRDQRVPVTAVVDVDVTAGAAQPSVRDVRVGPLSVPEALRGELNAQLQQVDLITDQGVVVDELATTDQELIVTGRPG